MDRTDQNNDRHDVHRQIDDRLIDALLVHLNDDQVEEKRDERLKRGMQAVHAATGSAVLHHVDDRSPISLIPPWRRRVTWAAAAMFMLVTGLIVITMTNRPALASLEDIVAAIAKPGDRTFSITVESDRKPRGRRNRFEDPFDPPERPGLDGAVLYLRDGTQFMLVRNDRRGENMLDGYDGHESWRIRRGVLVESTEGQGAGRIPMPELMAGIPCADLPATLQRVEHDYTIERIDLALLDGDGPELRHVLVRRNSPEVKGPEIIELWADSSTGMPRRIVFDHAKFQGSQEPRRLILNLTSEQPLPADWFSAEAHAADNSSNDN